VDADATRLEQVFWNLIKNAVKFTPAGGRVRVVCRRAGGAAVVEVTDTGAGIEPDALTRIFNAFEQEGPSVTRRFGGLGLGLAISKALVEAHRGAIRASSEGKGKGATFEVTLPLSRPAPAAEAPAGAPGWEAPGREDASRPLRILLVEDDEDSQEMLRRVLETGGHDVQAAGDVSTALALADARAFDLVLSDLGLPDGSGIDLMRELRRRGKTMPAIALTGYGQEEDVRQSHEAGFSTHLTKPINLDRLGRAILDVDGARAGGGGREREAARRERRPRRAREAGMG
jgi:two-component system CheB/CheR fusion protein